MSPGGLSARLQQAALPLRTAVGWHGLGGAQLPLRVLTQLVPAPGWAHDAPGERHDDVVLSQRCRSEVCFPDSTRVGGCQGGDPGLFTETGKELTGLLFVSWGFLAQETGVHKLKSLDGRSGLRPSPQGCVCWKLSA